jgi:hypothetical protein
MAMVEKIFVSYAHQDKNLVGGVEKALRRHGFLQDNDVVILDPRQNLQAGVNVREAIKDQMAEASKVVVITSNHSRNSQWVNYEVGMADALGKPIVVMGTGEVDKTGFLSGLSDFQSIDITDVSL